MKLEEIKVGDIVIEDIAKERVKIIAIKETKHYGPNRPVKVRFSDRHYEYYAPKDLIKEGKGE